MAELNWKIATEILSKTDKSIGVFRIGEPRDNLG